jgi:hypothetical protein
MKLLDEINFTGLRGKMSYFNQFRVLELAFEYKILDASDVIRCYLTLTDIVGHYLTLTDIVGCYWILSDIIYITVTVTVYLTLSDII